MRTAGTVLIAALVALLATPSIAHADPVRGIRCRLPRVVAPRGGVLLLPLDAERPGDHWPATLEVHLADGRALRGDVAWVGPSDDVIEMSYVRRRTWTGDPGRLLVRRIQPADDTTVTGAGAPYLIARLPLDGDGELRFEQQTLRADWCDVPETRASAGAVLERTAAPDRPDPESPFEYWRWVLLAEQLHLAPPEPPGGDDLTALVALHSVELWRIGLARLEEADVELADAACHLLTATCRDGDHVFAAWVGDPGRLAELLAYMLDFTRDARSMRRLVGAWIEREPMILWWPESLHGGTVRLDLVNRGVESALVRFRWSKKDIPIAVRVDAGRFARADVERPPLPEQRGLRVVPEEPPNEELLIEVEGDTSKLPVGRRWMTARPPGVLVGPLRPPLTLRDAMSGERRSVAPTRATFVQVRRIEGRWEVFFECRRPPAAGSVPPAPDDIETPLDTLRGNEAVTLLLGTGPDGTEPRVMLTVPESGWHEMRAGENDSTLEVHRRSYQGRWYARIVVPDLWLVDEIGAPARIGFIRAHGDSHALETAPALSLPWAPVAGRIAVDVTRWNEE